MTAEEGRLLNRPVRITSRPGVSEVRYAVDVYDKCTCPDCDVPGHWMHGKFTLTLEDAVALSQKMAKGEIE